MKNLILILFAIVCFSSCKNDPIKSDPNKTTFQEIESIKSDTTTYKVIVDSDEKITVYDKQTNLRVYEISNTSGYLYTALIYVLICAIALLIIGIIIQNY